MPTHHPPTLRGLPVVSSLVASLEYSVARLAAAVLATPRGRRVAAYIARTAPQPLAGRAAYTGWEGASRGRRTEGWNVSAGDASALAAADLRTLRLRSRDLVRNHPLAAKAIEVLSHNIVATGIRPKAETGADATDRAVDEAWELFCAHASADGTPTSFYSLQQLAVRGMFESGESLLVRRLRPFGSGLVPVQTQLLEADHLCTDRDGATSDGGRIDGGVMFAADDTVTGYLLYATHPGARLPATGGFGVSVVVPREHCCHLFVPQRPGQARGIPWLAPAMLALRDLDDFRDATRVRQRIQASFGAFVTGGTAPLGSPGGADDKRLAPGVGVDANNNPIETLEPGLICYLEGDRSVTFPSLGTPQGYSEYVRTEERYIASGLMLTYELLCADLSQVNYSSIKAGLNEFYRLTRSIQALHVIPRLCQPVWDWAMDAAVLAGVAPRPKRASSRWRCQWRCERYESVDREKDATANVLDMAAGIRALPDIIREQGEDPDRVFADIAWTQQQLAAAGFSANWQQHTKGGTDGTP